MMPTIETKRLILRPLVESDIDNIFKFTSNPNVARLVTWQPHQSTEDTKKFYEYVLTVYAQGHVTPLGITLKGTDTVIGFAGASWQSKPHKTMELETVLAEEFWGQGIVVEALQGVIDYCLKEFDIIRIQSRCKKENTQSFRMMQKLGMKHEGTIYSSLFAKGERWDMEMFSLIP